MLKQTKKWRSKVCSKGVYLGTDEKQESKLLLPSRQKLRQLDRQYVQVKIDFENGGSTRKEIVTVATLSDLAEEWFNNYKSWVTSENTLNRVRGYLDTYIIPRFGDYLPAKLNLQKFKVG